jgi:hypothetical protein
MSFQSLQNAYQLQQPTRDNVDPTKELLRQGQNFSKEMAGERGIMAAIEGAHFRPIIQKYIKSKLSDPAGFVNSMKKDVEGVRQKASTMAERAAAGADRVSESLQQTGGGLRGDPNVGRPALSDRPAEFGKRAEPQAGQLEREAASGGYGAEPLEAVPKPPEFGRGLEVPRGADPEGPFENLFPNPPVTEEEFGRPVLSAAQRARQATTEGGQKLGDVLRGGQPEQERAVSKPTPEPSVPSASTPAADVPRSAEDFPTPPTTAPEEAIRTQAPETEAPEAPRTQVDEDGLPKLPQTEKESVGKDIVKEEEKTAPTEEAEADAPGIGDVLAVGTALYGAIKGAVEARESKMAQLHYQAPQMASVALDSAPTFDSAFRGN